MVRTTRITNSCSDRLYEIGFDLDEEMEIPVSTKKRMHTQSLQTPYGRGFGEREDCRRDAVVPLDRVGRREHRLLETRRDAEERPWDPRGFRARTPVSGQVTRGDVTTQTTIWVYCGNLCIIMISI